MPAFLLRLLPYGVAALALVGAVLYIDHQGYVRAQTEQAVLERKISDKIGEAVVAIDAQTQARLSGIRSTDRTVLQPIITKELASAPRYSDPACALTPGVFDALQRARALSASSGGDSGAVPAVGDAR